MPGALGGVDQAATVWFIRTDREGEQSLACVRQRLGGLGGYEV